MVVKNSGESDKTTDLAAPTNEEGGDENFSAQDYLNSRSEPDQSVEIKRVSDNPLLQKIARILTGFNPRDWKTGGKELSPEIRIIQPRASYDFAYVHDIKDKSLVLRASTPVTCQYSPGGYMPIPISNPIFSVEIRDRVFDADKLVDPKYSNNFKGKFLDIVASGEVARKIFLDVHNLVKGSASNKQLEFENKASVLYDSLLERIQKREIIKWTSSTAIKDGRELTAFDVVLDDFCISVMKIVEGWEVSYQVILTSNKMEFSRNGGTPKLIFIEIQQLEQENQICSLEQKLKDLGLDDI
jgi:hypothetical protein